MTPPPLSQEEFAVFVKRAGLSCTPAELAEYYEAYGYTVAMVERVRRPRSIMAEPSLTFTPMQETAA
jgi:hypothetical protein